MKQTNKQFSAFISFQDRPFTRAVGNINEMQRDATNISLAPEYEGDMVVYRGKCKLEMSYLFTELFNALTNVSPAWLAQW